MNAQLNTVYSSVTLSFVTSLYSAQCSQVSTVTGVCQVVYEHRGSMGNGDNFDTDWVVHHTLQ